MVIPQEMTPEQFLEFVDQHPDKRFDFIDGEIVEVSPKPAHGRKQTILAAALEAYTAQHPVGVVYTEVLHVLDSDADYLTTPPLLAVEIRSDSQTRESQRRKASAYIEHGVQMAVLVLPGEAVEVYRPGKAVLVLTATDTLSGEDVLPGFALPLNRLLP
jgi:Uma2 family endonuclease